MKGNTRKVMRLTRSLISVVQITFFNCSTFIVGHLIVVSCFALLSLLSLKQCFSKWVQIWGF